LTRLSSLGVWARYLLDVTAVKSGRSTRLATSRGICFHLSATDPLERNPSPVGLFADLRSTIPWFIRTFSGKSSGDRAFQNGLRCLLTERTAITSYRDITIHQLLTKLFSANEFYK
jgi:hypothetical protein